MIDDSSFKILSEKIEPHSATVWLNQTVLNDDYYFKHYWLMSDVKDLKNIRAGMFDFEIGTRKFIERRKFLLDEAVEIAPIENAETEKLQAFLPEGIPFYRLQSANPKTIDDAIGKTIFAAHIDAKTKQNYNSSYSSFDDYNDYHDDDFKSLGEKYDEAIDDTIDEEEVERSEVKIDFSKIFQPANSRAILTFARPKTLPAPMFVEFERAAIVNLAAPESFNRDAFESAVARKFTAQMMITASGLKLNWETKSENNSLWRELKLPMLGWNVCYAIRGGELILTNDADFFQQISALQDPLKTAKQNSLFTALTVINFDSKENVYDNVFSELDQKNSADDFFKDNISSLLDSISELKKLEVKENYLQNIFDEEITFNF